MCSVSNVDALIGLHHHHHHQKPGAADELSPVKFMHARDNYFLVDIREADEIAANDDDPPLAEEYQVDAAVPMGKLFHLAGSSKKEEEEGTTILDDWKKKKKTIVLICSTGHRASLTAAHMSAHGFDVMALQRGIVGLKNPAAVVPDFVVVLGTKSNAEKITLAVTACANAAAGGETVVLALMGDGVCAFLRKGSNKEEPSASSLRVEEIFVGEPFKPVDALLKTFIGTGNGVILACTSCVKSRGIDFGSDLFDYVHPMQMPDLVRMLGEAKKSLQFM